jgi:beta-glucosidase
VVDLARALPADFTVGVGTSAWQVEGASATRGRCIWDDFAATPGAIVDGTTADPACDHVARMEADVDLLGWLGVDAYRFSVAWARVQPGGRGPTSPEGLDFYDRLCDRLLARGITPIVTLYHWDLPSELQADGGWANPKTGELFGQYANTVATRLGDRVGAWATLNEPWCSAFLGHAAGVHAPGRRDPAEALEVAYRLLVAHAHGMEGLRAAGVLTAGIVLNLMPTFPDDAHRDDPVLRRAACRTTCGSTRWPVEGSTPTWSPAPPGSPTGRSWTAPSSARSRPPWTGWASTTTPSSGWSRSTPRPSAPWPRTCWPTRAARRSGSPRAHR